MLIETKPGRTVYRCDDCGIVKDVQANKKNRHSLTHRCIKCHARNNSVLAAKAMVEKYRESGHFESLGQKLREWCRTHPTESNEACVAGYKAAGGVSLSSIGGKIGGRVTAEQGHLKKASSLGHTSEAKQKRHNTLRQRGKLLSSRVESELETRLRNLFDHVTHWVTEGGFSIDFYVQDVDCYVQMDGVYWHGLDRPYEELHPGPRAKFDRDRKCDIHFAHVGKRLVRITDAELSLLTDEELRVKLTSV